MARYSLRVNGRSRDVEAEPDETLLLVLRRDLDLTGSKYGCGEGHCGACTLLVDGHATRSCVTRVSQASSKPITTIEGLAGPDGLHAVQQAFLDVEAFQCGYCTPGMVMAAVGLLGTHPNPTPDDIARLMDRNVCRCGVFSRIVRAIQLAAARTAAPSSGARP